MTASGIRSIVVGVEVGERDGPDPVLATARTLATALGAELHVVHAVESGPLEPPLLPHVSEEVGQAVAALDRYLESLPGGGFAPDSKHVALGRAHRVLLERAEAVDADLLVLGPHRGVRLPTGGLGTTTHRLLRTAGVPCWIARGELDLPLRRVAAATDFSDGSRAGVDLALALAVALGGVGDSAGAAPPELALVYVEWPMTLRDDPDMEEKELIPRLRAELSASEERTGLEDAVLFQPRVVPGRDPSWGVLYHISDEPPGVTVLGTRGRGRVARALLGSVASVVARDSPGPVVLVPPWEARDKRAAEE